MNKCLILLTNYYPYFKGEEYIETEIKYLSNVFSHIYIIPTMTNKNMLQTRKVPNNVTIIKSDISNSYLSKLKMVMLEQKKARKNIKGEKLLKEDGKGSILAKIYTLYFECRAISVYSKILNALKQEDLKKYGSITIYSYWFYITARVAVELKNNYFKRQDVYTFSRAHGYDINEHINPIKFIPQRKFLLESMDNIFPVSQNGVDFLNNKYPGYKDKISVRRLGTEKKEVMTIGNNDFFRIVSCSTVRKLKRIDLIIEALAILELQNIEYKWTHIGGGPEFNNIKKLAEHKIKKSNYEFTGYLKNEDVLKWYQQNPTTVFINTSESEGLPVSIMEAMSMSLPIIATDVGGTKEIVKPNVTGYLLNSNCTAEDIAESLINIYSLQKNEYKLMRQEAYDLWEQTSNADKLYKQFTEEIYGKEGIYNLQ